MDKDTALLRARLMRSLRDFFDSRHYLEVETPILSPDCIPESTIDVFGTVYQHPHGQATPLFLLPSSERWMKRLLSQGWGSIYQVCRAFRNREPYGGRHNPEFTMLEWYTLNADSACSLAITMELLHHLAPLAPQCGLDAEALVLTMDQAFERWAGFRFSDCPDAEALCAAAGLGAGKNYSWADAFNLVLLDRIEPALPADRPVFLTEYPTAAPCLARKLPGGRLCDRWELYLGGLELANCFGEETDPTLMITAGAQELAARSPEMTPYPAAADVLSSPLPPCSGVALGVDRLLMLLVKKMTIEGVIFFPFSDILPNHHT